MCALARASAPLLMRTRAQQASEEWKSISYQKSVLYNWCYLLRHLSPSEDCIQGLQDYTISKELSDSPQTMKWDLFNWWFILCLCIVSLDLSGDLHRSRRLFKEKSAKMLYCFFSLFINYFSLSVFLSTCNFAHRLHYIVSFRSPSPACASLPVRRWTSLVRRWTMQTAPSPSLSVETPWSEIRSRPNRRTPCTPRRWSSSGTVQRREGSRESGRWHFAVSKNHVGAGFPRQQAFLFTSVFQWF